MIFLLLDTNQKENAKILIKASSNVKAKSDAIKYYQGSRRRLTTTYSECA